MCDSKTQLQLHAVVMHDSASVPSRKIYTSCCPVCLLRFDGRGQVLEHIGKCGRCLLNLSRLPLLNPDLVVQLQAEDLSCRASLLKSGWHKNKVSVPATRTRGPFFPVFRADGTAVVSRNGHPLGDCHPWRRSQYFSGKVPPEPRQGCPTSHFSACSSLCIVCRGASIVHMAA